MASAATDALTTIRAALPGGAWVDDALIRHVDVRVINTADEMFLLDEESAGPAARATALLQRCLLGGQVSAQSLTVGDREAVLLQLRRASIGEDFDCILHCPEQACGEQLELRLAIGDVLLPPYDDVRPTYSTTFTLDGHRHAIDFRLPCAGDLNAAAKTHSAEPNHGVAELLRRCVTAATVDDRTVDVDELDPAAIARVSDDMAAHDPQAEIQLDATCPACGHRFSSLFDTASYLLKELEARAQRLLTDVHIMALHYHWSERDILAMPSSRRDRYLHLITADSITAEFAGQPA
jgi:hypothetical protein